MGDRLSEQSSERGRKIGALNLDPEPGFVKDEM